MIEDSKTLLFYLFSLTGLIVVSILFTGGIESPEMEPLPTMTTPTVVAGRSTPIRIEADQKNCSSASQEVTLGYIPEMASLEGNRLVISGTVYASDFVTPLSGAWIDMWQTSRESQYTSNFPLYYNNFHAWFLTDITGHYEFTIKTPSLYNIIHLHYQVSDQNHCPLALQLLFVDEAALADASSTSFPRMKQVPHAPLPTSSSLPTELELAQGKVVGVLLRGQVDIVLPIPPSRP